MNLRGLAAAVTTAALTLTACGSEETQTRNKTQHNDADVAFATGMIPHHAQALMMVDMTMGRDLDPPVRRLTEDIRAAQTPEIETMTDWLEDWGEPIPPTPRDHVNAPGHGGGEHGGDEHGGDMDAMPGMMSEQQLDDLERARGERFEDRWLQMMIEHHEGAVEMAEVEQREGRFRPAVELAEDIERAQRREIEQMEELLGS